MTTAGASQQHRCYRCVVHDVQTSSGGQGRAGETPEVESLEATCADSGEEIFFTSGYSAREIAQRLR